MTPQKKGELGIDRRLRTNREKMQLVDDLRPTYTLSELLREVGLPRSSYFHHRVRLEVGEKYVVLRRAVTDILDATTAATATAAYRPRWATSA